MLTSYSSKMSRPKYRTKTAPIDHSNRFDQFPSAGPYPNITGMKNLYWGIDAYCIRCGVYVYKVSRSVWERY
jgi:hypothetical protein